MYEEALRRAIAPFGSISRFAKKLGLRRENVSSWLNRNIRISLEHALKIDQLTNGEVSWEELVPPHLVRLLKERILKAQQHSFSLESVYVSIARIRDRHGPNKVIGEEKMTLAEGVKTHDLQKPICVDSENSLIFGEKRIHAYEILGKKTIPAWRISLVALMMGKYSETHLCEVFNISERVAISLAVEQLLGNRQGQRKNDSLRENFPEFTGRTDELIAKILNFGNRKTYQQAKKIYLCGCYELIHSTDEQRIAISSAALLSQLPQNQQKQILTTSSKEIAFHINQLRSDRQSYRLTNHSMKKER